MGRHGCPFLVHNAGFKTRSILTSPRALISRFCYVGPIFDFSLSESRIYIFPQRSLAVSRKTHCHKLRSLLPVRCKNPLTYVFFPFLFTPQEVWWRAGRQRFLVHFCVLLLAPFILTKWLAMTNAGHDFVFRTHNATIGSSLRKKEICCAGADHYSSVGGEGDTEGVTLEVQAGF